MIAKWASSRWWPLVGIALLALLMLGPGSGDLPLLDRDEPRFAEATREMRATDNWLVPTFNGHERFDKPILIYWMMRVSYGVFGVNEFAARVPALLCTLAMVLFVGWTGMRWWDRRTGLLAGLIMGTCFQIFIHGRLAVADMPMVLAVAVAMVALIELRSGEGTSARARRGWWWAFYGALGIGFLAKGPIAWAVPILAALLWRWVLWRKPAGAGAVPLRWGRGALVVLGLVALWGVPALVVTAGRFFAVGIGEHVVQRGMEGFNDRGYSPFFYLLAAPLSLLPWSAWFGPAWATMRREWTPRVAWLAAWVVTPYLIFTAYATQLPHYVLPAFPAFALLAARGVVAGWAQAGRRWGERIVATLGLIAAAGLVWVFLVALPAEAEPLRWVLAGALLVIFGLTVLPWLASREHWVGVVVGVALVGLGGGSLGSGLQRVSLSRDIAAEVERRDPAGETTLVGWGWAEPSLVFYTERLWAFPVNEEALAELLASGGRFTVITLERECDPAGFFQGDVKWRDRPEVMAAGLGEGASSAKTLAGFNPGRSRWQEVRVLTLDGAQ